ncbi:MAG TPA: protoheme IX farnesyltransferase [Verrucomicrobiales bacterium]|nr:protoheme IX farnesyltransferase [Verrucomicrobiales bacterium]
MKATVETMESESLIDRSAWSVFSDLVKVRLTSLVLLTTLAGFYLATTEGMQFVLLLHTMVGTALLACGSSVLNQYLERHHDSLMPRTESRPLPAGLMHPERALWFGILLSITGCFYTWFLVNLLTCILGTLTLALYIFVYTPLKRLTSFNTVVGAIPGALPPLMGWTAVRGSLDAGGWSLFLILFLWQLPHFLAIAWMYKEEYGAAGYVMLPNVDPSGKKTARHALLSTIFLLPCSLLPVHFNVAGSMYAVGASVLGAGFIWQAIKFSSALDRTRARHLFFYSIIYLPLLLLLMTFDKVF